MFDIPFAYTRYMQLILVCLDFIVVFIHHYATANIILTVYGEKASRAQKAVFALVAGTLLNNVWVYSVYLIGDMASFSSVTYALVTAPNPVFALVYYIVGYKSLGLSPIRSVRLMTLAYMYVVSYKSLTQLIGRLLFSHTPGAYNYLLDAASLVVNLCIILCMSLAVSVLTKKKKFTLDVRDSRYIKSVPVEAVRCFLLVTLVYAVKVLPQLLMIPGELWGYVFSTVVVVLIFIISIMWDTICVAQIKAQNRNAYISSLVKSIDGFREIRHSFKNILQTYGGFIEVNDIGKLKKYHDSITTKTLNAETYLELTKRMDECPPLFSMLMDKLERANQLGVDMRMHFLLEMVYRDESLYDLCTCVGELADNAIDAAAESERKMVLISWERKVNGNRLFVITNSTSGEVDAAKCFEHGYTTKPGHAGTGLTTVRQIIDRDSTITIGAVCYQNEYSVYIEKHYT